MKSNRLLEERPKVGKKERTNYTRKDADIQLTGSRFKLFSSHVLLEMYEMTR